MPYSKKRKSAFTTGRGKTVYGRRVSAKYANRKFRGMTNKKLVKTIQRVVKKTAESKRKSANWTKVEMYHNSFNVSQQLNQSVCMPVQNVSDSGRIGDEIYVSGFRIKMLCGQKGDRPNVNWKWWVLKVPKGSAVTYSNWFRITTANVLLDDPNTDFVKVLKSGYMRPNQAGLTASGDDEFTFVKQLWIPYRKRYKFGPNNADITHNDDDIYFCMVAYDAFGTMATDNIAYVQMQSEVFYRDP